MPTPPLEAEARLTLLSLLEGPPRRSTWPILQRKRPRVREAKSFTFVFFFFLPGKSGLYFLNTVKEKGTVP